MDWIVPGAGRDFPRNRGQWPRLRRFVSAVLFPGIQKLHVTPANEIRRIVEPAEPAFAFVVIRFDAPHFGALRRAGLDTLEKVGPPPGIRGVTNDVGPGNTLSQISPLALAKAGTPNMLQCMIRLRRAFVRVSGRLELWAVHRNACQYMLTISAAAGQANSIASRTTVR
jgi:hypothetical protein